MKFMLPIIVLIFLSIIANAVENTPPQTTPPSYAIPCRDIEVIDGDTIIADILLPYGITLEDEHIRGLNYDAWEKSKRRRSVNVDDDEVNKGKAAEIALKEIIENGGLWIEPPAINTEFRDNYGRPLGAFWSKTDVGAWINIAEYMTEHGHTRSVGN